MSESNHRGKIIGAIIGVVAIIAATVMIKSSHNDMITMTGVFSNAAELAVDSDVRADGVAVGKVRSIALKDNLAHVTFTVSKEVLPIHQDASADVRTKDILGERYLAVDRGSPSSPEMAEPYVIGISHTTRSVGLQEVLDVVDQPTGASLAGLVTTLGEGVGGNGQHVAGTIAALAPAMARTDQLVRILSNQNRVLTSLVDRAQPVARAVAVDQGQQLDKLVGSTTELTSAVADNRAATADTVRRLPGTLASAQARLAQVAGVADPATQTLRSLRPVTHDLSDISDELRNFSDSADPALDSLPSLLKKTDDLLDEVGPVVRHLRPAGPGLRDVSSTLEALSEDGPLHERLVDLLEFAKGWALATKDYDATSHYFKAVTPYSPRPAAQFALGAIPGAPYRPTQADLPFVPGPGTVQIPGQPQQNEQPRARVPHDEKSHDGATGLSSVQEQNMVGQMLGGGR